MTDMDADAEDVIRQLTGPTTAVCPSCGKHRMAKGADMCTICLEDRTQRDRASKRRWHNTNLATSPASWLRQQLKDGPSPSRRIKHRAQAAGISRRELFDAFQQLEVAYDRRGNGPDHHTVWMLPADSSREPTGRDE